MRLTFVKLALTSLLLLAPLAATPALADCESQCKATFDTCTTGCTSDNAKVCVDSCWRGYHGCKNRCSR